MSAGKKSTLEIEVKLYIPDLSALVARLEAAQAKLVKPRLFERNLRYDNAERSLTRRDVVLRLREDDRVHLTFKGASVTAASGIHARFEAEVEVSDFTQMDLILGQLGYAPYMVYEKYRTTYDLEGAEVVLDEMPFGQFVEIEGDVSAIENAMHKLDLHDAPRYPASYAALFDIVRKNLNLPFEDLTFENFKGITVEENDFIPPLNYR